MKSEKITYQDDNLDVELTISEATVLIGMRRTRLKLEGDKLEGPPDDGELKTYDPDRHLLRITMYPDLVAATTHATGLPWPLDFNAFLELPEQLWVVWEAAVYKLNPHWLPPRDDPEEKKADLKSSTSS